MRSLKEANNKNRTKDDVRFDGGRTSEAFGRQALLGYNRKGPKA